MRAALYMRVSTEEQARHGLSLAEQLENLKAYAKSHGMTVVGIYEDAGISARKSYKKRPALLRLLEDVKEGKIDTILFIKLDRWFRNVSNYYAVQEILDKYHVSWQATEEDYETKTASGRFKVNIMLSVAQDEADRTGERIKFVFDGKRARGEPLSGSIPIGYMVREKKIVKDPETEAAINALFQKYLACGSVFQTMDYLKRECSIQFNYLRIRRILDNEAYCGTYFQVENMCPPYITKEQHEKIMDMRKYQTRRTKSNNIFLFSGIISCGECGHAFVGASLRGSPYAYYCRAHRFKVNDCPNSHYISEKKLVQYLMDSISYKIPEYKAQAEKIANKEKDPARIEEQIAKQKARLSRLKDLYLNQLMELEEYKREHAAITEEIEALNAKKKPVQKPDFTKIDQMLSGNWKAMYQDLPTEEKREFWRVIIKRIRVYEDQHIEFDLNV